MGRLKLMGSGLCVCGRCLNLWAKHLDELEVKSFLLGADCLIVHQDFFFLAGDAVWPTLCCRGSVCV